MKQKVTQLLFMHNKNVEAELDTEERNINYITVTATRSCWKLR